MENACAVVAIEGERGRGLYLRILRLTQGGGGFAIDQVVDLDRSR